jgi:2-polyprenyl-3-methyl-5-hydroxy-6-metoxy-1,4-benzoquinol methylase
MLAIADPVKLKAAAAYNAAADHFDEEALSLWAKYGRRTVDRLALPAGAFVLDVGCGTGASAIPAAEKVGPKGKVIAVDLAERLLEIARRKAATRSLENIEFRLGDMENLGYPDQHFAAVICVFAVFFVPDVAKQIKELWRMVHPGGQLAITTWGPRMWEPGATGWWSAVRELRPDLCAAFNPWDRIADPNALREFFSEAGVAEAEIVPEDGRQALRSPEDWWTMVLGSGYRWTVDQMERAMAERLRKASLAWIRSHNVTSVETNVIYAIARKRDHPQDAELERN